MIPIKPSPPRARRLTLSAVLLAAVLIPVLSVLHARPKPRVCPDGRFLVQSGNVVDPPGVLEPLVVGQGQASIGKGCPPASARMIASRRGPVKLRVTWSACSGVTGKVKLTGKFDTACASLGGMFVARKARIRKPFSARLSTCDDAVLDQEGGEQCNSASPCPVGEECTFECKCVPEGQAPTTTTTTTTLPPPRFSRNVEPLLTAKCAIPLCHSGAFPQSGLDLRAGKAHAQLVNVDSIECTQKRIAPGAPGQSYMITKLEGGGPCFIGTRMPEAEPLPADDIEMIRRWIANGAQDD